MDSTASPNQSRQSTRLEGFDYSQDGAYFVTLCTEDRACLFGEVVNVEVRLSALGSIADSCWRSIPAHFPQVVLDAYVIMPNHMHGIIINHEPRPVGARHAVPLQNAAEFGKPITGSLATIIRSYKSAVTRAVNLLRGTPGYKLWQRNYYDHIIRNLTDADRIRAYIDSNPATWLDDENYPARMD